jgi:hypothetical protein
LTSGELKEVANPKDDLLPHHPLVMVDFWATGTDYRSLTSELQGETIITTYRKTRGKPPTSGVGMNSAATLAAYSLRKILVDF